MPPPPLGVEEGTPYPWTEANVATAVLQVMAHLALTAASGARASRPSCEKSPCWLSASGSPVDAAGP